MHDTARSADSADEMLLSIAAGTLLDVGDGLEAEVMDGSVVEMDVIVIVVGAVSWLERAVVDNEADTSCGRALGVKSRVRFSNFANSGGEVEVPRHQHTERHRDEDEQLHGSVSRFSVDEWNFTLLS